MNLNSSRLNKNKVDLTHSRRSHIPLKRINNGNKTINDWILKKKERSQKLKTNYVSKRSYLNSSNKTIHKTTGLKTQKSVNKLSRPALRNAQKPSRPQKESMNVLNLRKYMKNNKPNPLEDNDEFLFDISDDTEQDDKYTPTVSKRFDTKKNVLDTPFLTKGFTETESDDTTLRGAVQVLKEEQDFNNKLEKRLKNDGIFDLKYKKNYESIKSSMKYSQSCNSSSDSTEKHSVSNQKNSFKIAQKFITEDKENSQKYLNEIQVSQKRHIKEEISPGRCRPVYSKPLKKKKLEEVTRIVQKLDTPESRTSTSKGSNSQNISEESRRFSNQMTAKIYKRKNNPSILNSKTDVKYEVLSVDLMSENNSRPMTQHQMNSRTHDGTNNIFTYNQLQRDNYVLINEGKFKRSNASDKGISVGNQTVCEDRKSCKTTFHKSPLQRIKNCQLNNSKSIAISESIDKESTYDKAVNPMYLVTRSSCDTRKSHKIKVPLTRQPVKDFGSAYLAPKMWPKTKNRMNSHRGSLMPQSRNPLSVYNKNVRIDLNSTSRKEAFTEERGSTNDNDQTPLIFSDKKQTYNSICSRKFSLLNNDITKNNKYDTTMSTNLRNVFGKRSNSTMAPKSNSVKNLLVKKQRCLLESKKSPKFSDAMRSLKNLQFEKVDRDTYSTTSANNNAYQKSRNKGMTSKMTDVDNSNDQPHGENSKKLVEYILKEIDKLDHIKKNLSSVIVGIQQKDEVESIDQKRQNTTYEEVITKRSLEKPPLASESFSDIMMARLLSKENCKIESNYNTNSTNYPKAPLPRGYEMARSRSGNIGNLYSHNLLSVKRPYTQLEKIVEKPKKTAQGQRRSSKGRNQMY
ncbi:unnamed protein product [Moneuplotes crassus]|uniref:Uncharacterized protein n=1 Tax=Euplotes crassus TaxID=5936 RepID=A0AAD1Y2A3_EUPCR|nr:unnamed protein product [Moneuplotes crassus]